MTMAMIRRLSMALTRNCSRLQVSARGQSSVSVGQETSARLLDHEPDPFCLRENDDSDLSSIVQGLYSSNRENHVPSGSGEPEKDAPLGDRTQVYKAWIEDSVTKRREAKLALGGDLVHSAAFGAIRFDQENFPREEEEEDEEGVPLSQRDSRRDYNPSEIYQDRNTADTNPNARQHKHSSASVTESATENSSSDSTSAKVEIILEKNNNAIMDGPEPIPSIYQIKSLNDLTHGEMWDLLKEHISFQNEFLVAVNKPYGLPMHTPSRECRHTVLDFLDELTTYCQSSEKVDPLHRLDKDTTGVLLFAKTQIAATIIKEKFAARQMRKKYLVVTKNCPPIQKGTIEIPIAEGKVGGTGAYRSVLKPDLRKYKINNSQEGAKQAVTHFQVIRSSEHCALLEIRPETGLKHQIRLHLGMGIGCPVLGDHKYSHREKLAPQRLSPAILSRLNVKQSKVRHLPLHLHCSTIEFNMPESFSKNMEPVYIHSKPPKYFLHTLRKLWLSKG